MWKTCCLLLACCAVVSAADKKPPTETETKIKALKAKIAPAEVSLAEARQDLAFAAAAPVNGKNEQSQSINGTSRYRTLNFKTAESKRAALDKCSAAVKKATDELATLKAELKELQKPPKPEKPKT